MTQLPSPPFEPPCGRGFDSGFADLNWHWNADGFDACSRRPAWLENLLAGLQSGRLFDGVRNGSQQPAALRLRTFNSRLVRGAAPPSIMKPQPFSVGVFSCLIAPVPAYSCGFLRMPADFASRPNWPFRATFHSLLAIPRSLELARSPQRPQRRPIKIRGLRADESSGWIAALVGKSNKNRCILSVVIDTYRQNVTSLQHEKLAPDYSGSRRPTWPHPPTRPQ